MPSQHTSPRPVRIRFHDPEQRTNVLRGVGSLIRCETCGESKRSRSWSELRAWLRGHIAENHTATEATRSAEAS